MSFPQSMKRLAGLLLAASSVLVTLTGLVCNDGCAREGGRESPVREMTWKFQETPMGRIDVAVAVPTGASPSRRMPVLIALHGQGESRKPPEKGARGWLDDYRMRRTIARLASPPLYRTDFGGMVDDERLERFNRSLKARPYRGVIVVCPYLPDDFHQKHMHAKAATYGDFLLNTLLPRVYKETPAVGTPTATGIDGVSLGGRVAVLVGLDHPARFGAVGGTQAAFGERQVPDLARRVAAAREKNPGLRFRLISSERDRFRKMTVSLSRALEQRAIPHHVDIVKGDHSYEFNRGPGGYEMLLYYDRVLRGEKRW